MSEKEFEEEIEEKIEKAVEKACRSKKVRWHEHRNGAFGGIYGLAMIGAAVYYIGQADGFWIGVLGILKAIIWPAMLIYKVFTLIQM